MSLHLSKATWFTMIVCALVLGIWPGVALSQEQWIWGGVLVGWFYIPMGTFQFFTQSFPSDLARLQWLASLGYLLALPGYSVCAYLAMRQTGRKRSAFLFVVVAALISALASIPAAIITMSYIQNVSIWNFMGYLPALYIHVIILVQLFISALLGWLISVGLFHLLRKRRENVAVL